MQYVAVIEQAEDGGFAAYVPDLPVCFTVGRTMEEVRLNIKEAIQVYVDEAKRVGLALPDPRKLELVEVDF